MCYFFYAGRASSSPAMDVFITLLSLGINGYKNLITQRKEMYTYLKEELTKVALKHGERLLETKNNPISLGKQWFNAQVLYCAALQYSLIKNVDTCGVISSAGFVDWEALMWQPGWVQRNKGSLQPGRPLSRLQPFFITPKSALLPCQYLLTKPVTEKPHMCQHLFNHTGFIIFFPFIVNAKVLYCFTL